MSFLERLVHTPLARAAGWTLFHSLWEGALAAVVVLAVLFLARSPRVRYACACAAIFGTFAAFAITFAVLVSQVNGPASTIPLGIPEGPVLLRQLSVETTARFRIEDALPWLAPFWIAGVIFFHLRSLASWVKVQRLRDRGVCGAPDPWPQRLERLRARLRISRPVALLETCLADVPVVLGWMRPLILVPAGMLAGMPAPQMEAILLHELAHIRRYDYLVNLLETVVRGFLFYHPAIWWMSHLTRTERENCCDDLVVAINGDARQYAAALTALEQTRRTADEAAPAATGGNLLKRIRRLLNEPEGIALAPLLSAGILTIVVAGALVAWQSGGPAQTQPPAQPGEKVSPYTKWLEEVVPYIIVKRERAAFLSLRTDEERDHFIEQFWARRDPTPGTPENEFKEEHYRRIAEANKRFGWRAVPGWKTDRGRIYIMFGPPDELETHPDGRPAEGNIPARNYPVEAWLYRQIKGIGDRVIVEFEDASRTGDFRMTRDPRNKSTVIRRP